MVIDFGLKVFVNVVKKARRGRKSDRKNKYVHISISLYEINILVFAGLSG